MTGWRFWIDRGGTFTDVVAADPEGRTEVVKLLSQSPAYDDAAIEGIRRVLGITAGPIPPGVIDSVSMGTTVATNALLERAGEPTALVVTEGFGDALRIGYQNRPRLFDLAIHRPEPLYATAVEVAERVDVAGRVLQRPEPGRILTDLRAAREQGCTSAAVVLMHGYRYPEHEDLVAGLAREAGFEHVSTSHECSALIKFVARGDTTVVDAYLSPILLRYTRRVAADLPGVDLRFMQSNGGLAQATAFRGKDAVLSGPAGGLIGAVSTSRKAGFDRVVTFDMGGTSTDVAHFGGELERSLESEVAGVRLRAPMLEIHTVAAGGGSICFFDGSRLRVGPDSAGADPGPACYGSGGPLTVTDCNLVLGLIRPEHFPATFGPRQNQPLDVAAARGRLAWVTDAIAEATGDTRDPAAVAAGFRAIAVANMANAIKKVSVARGHDVTAYTLACFGGAGGQHACAVADELGITSVVIHPLAGVLSAVGMSQADTRLLREASVEVPLAELPAADLEGMLAEAARDAEAELRSHGASGAVEVERHVHLKYGGSDTALPVGFGDDHVMRESFASAHERRFGFTMPDRQIVVDAIAVEAIERAHPYELRLAAPKPPAEARPTPSTMPRQPPPDGRPTEPSTAAQQPPGETTPTEPSTAAQQPPGETTPTEPSTPLQAPAEAGPTEPSAGSAANAGRAAASTPPAGPSHVRSTGPGAPPRSGVGGASRTGPSSGGEGVTVRLGGRDRTAPVFERDRLFEGQRVAGPAVIAESVATTVVEPGWAATVLPGGELQLQRMDARPARVSVGTESDPVMLEIFNNLFMAVAERMGVTLQQTSRSVNIRERLDFSCAIFDPGGGLVANAPHIPVHLGSMGESVRAILAEHGDTMRPGDVYAVNDPYGGGTHLPDITVVTPVFGAADSGRPLFFVASRGHHADIGGITPGSMPPMSRTIHDEGALLRNVRIVHAGRFDEQLVRRILAEGPHPARTPDRNVNDLTAQIAANANGVADLQELIARYGLATVQAYMGHVQANAAECVRRAIDTLSDGHHVALLDDGTPVEVRVTVDRTQRRVAVDFAGTGLQRADNFNAPRAVTRAAVLYSFRCLVADDIPLNDGCLEPVELRIPAGSLLDPQYPAAVVAGNVEVSQIVTDTLLAALGACAASQGTMNNLTFGTDEFQYYETVCGGTGAGPDFAGTDAVHSHMTNSRITDPEVLELRHPVLVRRFAVRTGSGGTGRHRGGDGAVRELEFRVPMRVSLLSGRRREPPFGLSGGGGGEPGRTLVRDARGVRELAATDSADVEPGDRLVLMTPGGGGFGLATP